LQPPAHETSLRAKRLIARKNLELKSDNSDFVKLPKDKANRRRRKKMKSEPRLRGGHSAQGSRVVSATHAARSFSELLDRVCYRGESFVIERGGELVCEISRVKPRRTLPARIF
jgi:hypothetical protein